MSDLNPVAIILVTSGTRGDRLLFRYPFEDTSSSQEINATKPRLNNPYSAHKISEDRLSKSDPTKASAKLTKNGVLVGFEDKTLANLLAVKTTLCGTKFTVKIDDVRFVGFPIQIEHSDYLSTSKHHSQSTGSGKSHRINTVNVVFALSANIVDSAMDAYHSLSKELVVAVRQEEQRCHYLSLQSKTIRAVFDHVHTQSQPSEGSPAASPPNPFRLILQRSQLANELKQVFVSLVDSGVVSLSINRWVEVNFCLPHKVHVIVTGSRVLHLEARDVEEGLEAMRPYHGLLLLPPGLHHLLNNLPFDSSPALLCLAKVIHPTKNLLTLSLESDLSLSQVFQVACRLVFWGKAMVIFPMCESNEYMLSPRANTLVNSNMVEQFVEEFPNQSLHVALADFSLPTQLWHVNNIVEHPQIQQQRVLMVIWMLQRRLLIQIHKYVYFMPQPCPSPPTHVCSSANSSIVDSSSHVQVEEESLFRYLMEDHSNLERAPSMSDVASVNSDESLPPSLPLPSSSSASMLGGKQLSKSPSLEVPSDGGSVVAEDGTTKSLWHHQAQHGSSHPPLNDLTPGEKAAVLQCPAAKVTEDLQLFSRLLPYFNGRHHLEEIMFYENMRRSQLLTIIEKFKSVLIVVTHE